ncbi:MAG: hypothetical protein QF467_08415, partial [SAR202 cluster bacterium]|nr:hypothetical protein [SAR202 cluster bacterium]
MKRALKWSGIGVLSVVVLLVVLVILFGEVEVGEVAEEQPAASVSTSASVPTPTSAPTQASEGQPSTEAEAALKRDNAEAKAASKHNLAGQDYFDAGKYLLALTEFKMIQDVSSDPVFLGQSY